MPIREQNSNKGTFGKVLNFAGSKNYIGAAYLSTVAILKAGGGFAALATEKNIIHSVSTLLPEAVYLSQKEGLKQIDNFSVVLIGCGLGRGKCSQKLFHKIMKKLNYEYPTRISKLTSFAKKFFPPRIPLGSPGRCRTLVIDADGLNILAKYKHALSFTPPPPPLPQGEREEYAKQEFIYPRPQGTREEYVKREFIYPRPQGAREVEIIITPHPLEAARLLGIRLQDVLDDLEGSAKKLSEKYNCVTVLKTHRTIICDGKEIYINQHGNSALAKAGSGDVLAGIIAGLLASSELTPFDAAKLGVYLHSRAGEIASEELTEYSVLASDLPNYLPQAIKEIL